MKDAKPGKASNRINKQTSLSLSLYIYIYICIYLYIYIVTAGYVFPPNIELLISSYAGELSYIIDKIYDLLLINI